MFGSLLRDMEGDSIFGAQARAMNRMMNSMFGDFGIGGPAGMGMGMGMPMGMGMDLMPFGMNPGMPAQRNIFSPFSQMMNPGMMVQQMTPNLNGSTFAQSQVSYMTVSADGSGAPHVYQSSSVTRQGPGGVRETRKAVSDSRTGVKKVHVGRHLGERAHILEREENLFTGQREEHEDLVNLDHEERDHFNREWRDRRYGRANSSQEQRSITSGIEQGSARPSSSSVTYDSGVTIEEINDEEDQEMRAAAPTVPTVRQPPSPSRRHTRDRRHKSGKRSKRLQ